MPAEARLFAKPALLTPTHAQSPALGVLADLRSRGAPGAAGTAAPPAPFQHPGAPSAIVLPALAATGFVAASAEVIGGPGAVVRGALAGTTAATPLGISQA